MLRRSLVLVVGPQGLQGGGQDKVNVFFFFLSLFYFLRQGLAKQPAWPLTFIFLRQSPKCWDYRHTPPHLPKDWDT
jgi:hypothetical protein